jgi:hypothetical protein
MTQALKTVSAVGTGAAATWFFMKPDFAAVLLGILSLSVFMITFLPIASDSQR